jgi:hypothetical protein
MPTITIEAAVERIGSQIQQFGRNDLVEVYNEVFPHDPVTMGGDIEDARLLADVMNHVQEGLEVEEVIDLWNVVFPEHRNVWYDDEANNIRYNEEPERVESSD